MSPAVGDFVSQAAAVPLHQLPAKLETFPQDWPLPRGDFYHWILLLDRFDRVLELFTKEYGLTEGPQTQPFARRLLLRGDAEDGKEYQAPSDQELDTCGFSQEGDCELVEVVLNFTKLLLEHCGNRSLYQSSSHVAHLLNTTSLSLLRVTLRLSLRLAQRYQVARFKNHSSHSPAQVQKAHFDFNMDDLHKLSQPFPRPLVPALGHAMTPGKSKDKATLPTFNPSDLVTLAKDPKSLSRFELANVTCTYYDQSATTKSSVSTQPTPTEALPPTPTPVRRASVLGPSRDRPSPGDRSVSTNDAMANTPVKSRETDGTSSNAPKVYQISADKVTETSAWALVKGALQHVPKESCYDVLNRIRTAKAFSSSDMDIQRLVETRLLAIATLAYAHTESKFTEKVGQPDAEEPRRFHLATQLCDLLQPSANGHAQLSLELETTVLQTIEALGKCKHKVTEVAEALALNVNHGIFYYELRRVIATLRNDGSTGDVAEIRQLEWRDAMLDLVDGLVRSNPHARFAEKMVSAGIIGILVEMLQLRTTFAERYYEKILGFFDGFVHGLREAFQTLANAKGLDAIADLTEYEVRKSLENAQPGKGLPPQFKSKVVDYDIPYWQQATLRQLFKVIGHLFEHGSGMHDFLLRNLIDTPQILGSLRTVIANAHIFGSNVFNGAISIVSTFIHNEPTSYQIIAEAGLSKGILEAVTQKRLPDEPSADERVNTSIDASPEMKVENGKIIFAECKGILPVGETMQEVPTAFGAICLNEAGMKLFQESGALMEFLSIFLSPAHVRALEEDQQVASNVGTQFEELSRHHPQLKEQIIGAVTLIVKRVVSICRLYSELSGAGASLRYETDEWDDEIDKAYAVPYINACVNFLEGFFHNTSMTNLFCEQGGAELLLDLATATCTPYDFRAFHTCNRLAGVVKTMCDTKPHLVLPSVIRRVQASLKDLRPFMDGPIASDSGVEQSWAISLAETSPPHHVQLEGTSFVRALKVAQIMSAVLSRTYSPPHVHGHRQSPSSHLFQTLNFTDIYMQLVDDLGRLHSACLWESIALTQSLESKTDDEKSDPKAHVVRKVGMDGVVQHASDGARLSNSHETDTMPNGESKTEDSTPEKCRIHNLKTIRYLLGGVHGSIEHFFHMMGQSLAPKRLTELAPKQNANVVAERFAESFLWELGHKRFGKGYFEMTTKVELEYQAQLLEARTSSMLRPATNMESYGSKEALTIILSKFYLKGGLSKLNSLLGTYYELLDGPGNEQSPYTKRGLDAILNFYHHIARAKCINEASQSSNIIVRDATQADYFMPGQFLVEIRHAILPAVADLWNSERPESVGPSMKKIIDILRVILKGEGEDRALKRSAGVSRRVAATKVEFKLKNTEHLSKLTSAGYAEDLAREGLFRCNGNESMTTEYCSLRNRKNDTPRFTIPQSDEEQSKAATNEEDREGSVDMEDATSTERSSGNQGPEAVPVDQDDASEDDNFGSLGELPADIATRDLDEMMPRLGDIIGLSRPAPEQSTKPPAIDTEQPFITIDDLEDRRADLRTTLPDRCLEILSVQPWASITFDLADLIQAVVSKSGPETANPRAEIGSTLVSSLISLQGEEPSEDTESARTRLNAKIAAYAHLVALILQDRDFFDSTLDELKDSLDSLVIWVQQGAEEQPDAPWVEMILLIIERVLAEDEQPVELKWTPPPADDPLLALPQPSLAEPVVDDDTRTTLFEALVALLPKMGKNAQLALSVTRVLVVLTRRRAFAARLSEKPSMSRLFLMIRQLAGSVSEKLHSSFMLILRHLIEDETTLRQIVRTEIKTMCENQRRPLDTATYTRNLHHLVLRDPQIFLEVTEELLEVVRYDGNPHRAQSLALKREAQLDSQEEKSTDQSASDINAKGSNVDSKNTLEPEPPVVKSSDGVVQFLLRELSNFREVEDKAVSSPAKATQQEAGGDVEMADGNASGSDRPRTPGEDIKPQDDKPTFKAEEHPIFIYRCFLLQCLTEVLGCYNRTKVEFINFSRKSENQSSTPSKPRSGTLNYLLNVLIPAGTLEHKDDVGHRKRLATSTWAINVLVSLCSKTAEDYKQRNAGASVPEDNTDLAFVRKFVLEHALRSFKEAMSSNEPLHQRYSRLLALGDLFNRMLTGKPDRNNAAISDSYATSQKQLGRLMYERNFIGTLTSSIAELDLNFPNAKRVVKYILRPLKWLTDLAVALSQETDLSSSSVPGTSTEEDEISSATSVSDQDDEREQTPDLFRNSALSMFEAGNDDEEESGSEDEDGEDEEMYDDGYDEGMDYEEEPIPEHGDVVSDEEDEEIEGIGEVEGMPGDVDIEVVMDDEDDEDEDSEDDDDDEDQDNIDDDQDGFDDQMDEITGDDENASLADDNDEGDWEDDGAEFDAHGDDGGSPHGGPLEHIAHVLGGHEEHSDPGDDGVIHVDMDNGQDYFEDEMPPEDLDDEEEDEEGDYENQVVYEPEVEDDEEQQDRWDVLPPVGALGQRFGHRGFHEMFSHATDPMRMPPFRTHRQASTSRGDDEGTNPLLQRDGGSTNNNREMPPLGRRTFVSRGGDIYQEMLAVLGPGGAGPRTINIDQRMLGALGAPAITLGRHGHHAIIEMDRTGLGDMRFSPRYNDLYGMPTGQDSRVTINGGDEAKAVSFQPALTMSRWQEEARMLFGGKHHEKATRVINGIARLLVPAAMEAKRKRDIEESEKRAAEDKQREEERKKAEAEQKEREEREKKEQEEREAKEAEERAAREAEEAAARAREAEEAAAAAAVAAAQRDDDTSMEGVEQSQDQPSDAAQQDIQPSGDQEQSGPSDEPPAAERVTISLRGREMDITNLGIDREYLEALPEEMREEVIMAQFAEQRAQQVQSGEQPSEISREFLDALPPEIQQELLRQEATERRRREREEARRQAQQSGNNASAPQPEDMNNADFMAMLDPALRQAVLMEADDAVLAHLPEHLRREAENLMGGRRPPRLERIAGDAAGLRGALDGRVHEAAREASRQRRPVVQMLDKAGIATLLRLMFVSLPSGGKTALHGILGDICKNTQNRAEVISILLSILQDGTADVSAVERSFAQLSLRAKQMSGPKTPQPLKRSVTNQMLTTPGLDLSPLNIVHQCLLTLNALSVDNSRVPSFFLSEHETVVKSTKKGKSREKAAKFPLNALLTLLDRKLIIENTGVMETLATLLSRVTHPLNILLRRSKEAQDAEKKDTETANEGEGDASAEVQAQSQRAADVAMGDGNAAQIESGNGQASTEKEQDSKLEAAGEKKRHRDLVPPDVPEENLRLVVNILAARDCPSKTFSDTVDIIKNLSMIPGAKEVFAKELIRQAQELTQSISDDLDGLTKHISSSESNTDLQGMALASFSSSSAKQRKLLRVLIALDHLFDPKRTPTVPSPESNGDVDPKLKQDIQATLHESSTFDKLWRNLSACLTAIRNRGNMISVATILLPVIESLMVVCRNCTPKEPSQDSGTTPPPETRMEGLFFKFTDDHRKILNELIRNNPKLMNGNLAVLAKNSKVLEFDNKRNYFSRKLHHRSAEERVPHPSLQLNIRRNSVFLDSFKSLYFKSGNEIKYGKLNIRFHGEEGIDAGGVSREWFGAMARQMFNPDYALFNPVASDRTTFHPNPLSDINNEHLMFFKFIGRIIGKALYEGRVLDCYFSRAVYKRILGKAVSLKDMETLDLDFYKSMDWMLNNDITGVTFETFSTEVDRFGEVNTVDLIPNGRNIEVTEDNKQDYVRLIVEHRLINSVSEQLDNFLVGFYEIIPAELISIFNEQELELLISGLPEIDIDDWKNNSEYHNYQITSPQIQWFWRAVRSFDQEEKAKLLQFVTGTSKVPLNGFKELEGMNGFAKFNIHRDYSSKDKLPTSHTCFNQLDLPEYDTYEKLRAQLYTSITAGSDYFGFA